MTPSGLTRRSARGAAMPLSLATSYATGGVHAIRGSIAARSEPRVVAVFSRGVVSSFRDWPNLFGKSWFELDAMLAELDSCDHADA